LIRCTRNAETKTEDDGTGALWSECPQRFIYGNSVIRLSDLIAINLFIASRRGSLANPRCRPPIAEAEINQEDGLSNGFCRQLERVSQITPK
jgi:hypothetical protein